MKETRWHIGKELPPLDQPPYRAYFYVVEDNMLVDANDYDTSELTAELGRRRAVGESAEPFQQALEVLLRANA
jgi:hypothetical protein